jgi:heme/copper-type cytochrome/quinol oxidase subunit 3
MKLALRSRPFADSLATASGVQPIDGEEDTGGTSPIASDVLAVAIFIASEVMLFGGLLSAFMILRAENSHWPPLGQPRLPLLVTTLNSLILFASGWTVIRAVRAAGNGERDALTNQLSLTLLLGAVFLLVQGSEWIRLIHFGLTVGSSVYGGLFYTLVGLHAVHVMGAVVALCVVLRLARQGRYSPADYSGVVACALYWCFVVLLWGVIYVAVYLS